MGLEPLPTYHLDMTDKTISFEQRVLLVTWGVGLILVNCKLVGWIGLSWGEATFPLWGGTVFFFAWGMLYRGLRR